MSTNLFLFPFLISFALSSSITFLIIFLTRRFQWKTQKRKSSRHIHCSDISRLGGIAIIISFLITIFLDRNLVINQSLWGVIVASIIIFIIGIWDDLWEISWKTQFFFQVAISMLVFIMNIKIEYITNPFGGLLFLNWEHSFLPAFLLIALWIVIFINSMNWLDGIDGLSAGVTLIGALAIFVVSLMPEVNQPPMGIISLILAGSVLGFLVFNFNPSRILSGTSGSMFMGFILSIMAVFAGAKIATAVLVMAVPIIDFLWVIGERVKNKESIFKADHRHLHYKLMEIGWSQKKIAFFFYIITFSVTLVALNTKSMGKLVALGVVSFLMIVIIIFVNRKIKEIKQQKEKKFAI